VDVAEYDDMMRRMLAVVVRVEEAIVELRDFNRAQLAINARLETLLTRVLRNDADANGREA
jgi:hypothetical protein